MSSRLARNQPHAKPSRLLTRRALLGIVLSALLLVPGCMPAGGNGHLGPGRRKQALALTPTQELSLGRQSYNEIKLKNRDKLLAQSNPWVQKVKKIGANIQKAAENRLLQKEINLDVEGYAFEWEYNVIVEDQINAFCLPGGKIAVYSGLLKLIYQKDPVKESPPENPTLDSQLATVMSHEVSHALAHHSSERIARQQMTEKAAQAANGVLSKMDERQRKWLIGLLSGGARIGSLHYDREQETEADHIGLFLLKFAGYDPRQALVFWEKMRQASGGRHGTPAILSTHPGNEQRIRQIQKWLPQVEGAYAAYQRMKK